MKNSISILIIAILLLNVVIWRNYSYASKLSDYLEITFLDVGQGDSIIIKTPNNSFGLIDGGPGNKALKEIEGLYPSLNTLDFILLTHPDSDHLDGLIDILNRYEVKKIFFENVNKSSNSFNEFKSTILNDDISSYVIDIDDDFSIDSIDFNVIWPEEVNNIYETENINNTSIGLVITYKEFSIYTAGDLESSLEIESLENFKENDLDMLKVGHHGSSSSSSEDFVKALIPKVCVISVGENNKYGHPTKQVIETLNGYCEKVFRTDEDGILKFSTDGDYLYLPNDATIKV